MKYQYSPAGKLVPKITRRTIKTAEGTYHVDGPNAVQHFPTVVFFATDQAGATPRRITRGEYRQLLSPSLSDADAVEEILAL